MKYIALFLTGFLYLLGASASIAQEKQACSYEEVVDSLRKVKASTEVGVNLQTYTDLLIDAKTEIDKVTAACENENYTGLRQAMSAYTDAAAVWNTAMSGKVSYRRGIGKEVMDKYSIPVDEGETYQSYPGYITSRYLIRQLWDRAERALNQSQ